MTKQMTQEQVKKAVDILIKLYAEQNGTIIEVKEKIKNEKAH